MGGSVGEATGEVVPFMAVGAMVPFMAVGAVVPLMTVGVVVPSMTVGMEDVGTSDPSDGGEGGGDERPLESRVGLGEGVAETVTLKEVAVSLKAAVPFNGLGMDVGKTVGKYVLLLSISIPFDTAERLLSMAGLPGPPGRHTTAPTATALRAKRETEIGTAYFLIFP